MKDKKFQVWRDAAVIPQPTLDIAEPPCKHCQHFSPRVLYGRNGYEGVTLCIADEMESDFSCFDKRKEP